MQHIIAEQIRTIGQKKKKRTTQNKGQGRIRPDASLHLCYISLCDISQQHRWGFNLQRPLVWYSSRHCLVILCQKIKRCSSSDLIASRRSSTCSVNFQLAVICQLSLWIRCLGLCNSAKAASKQSLWCDSFASIHQTLPSVLAPSKNRLSSCYSSFHWSPWQPLSDSHLVSLDLQYDHACNVQD